MSTLHFSICIWASLSQILRRRPEVAGHHLEIGHFRPRDNLPRHTSALRHCHTPTRFASKTTARPRIASAVEPCSIPHRRTCPFQWPKHPFNFPFSPNDGQCTTLGPPSRPQLRPQYNTLGFLQSEHRTLLCLHPRAYLLPAWIFPFLLTFYFLLTLVRSVLVPIAPAPLHNYLSPGLAVRQAIEAEFPLSLLCAFLIPFRRLIDPKPAWHVA